ncbi:acyl-CoA Delta-9 desaturase [Aethina tumida]|uniref:acyl-CoA Delta-9 desaturase n=1 Tax=Aethina tumida TaxID=116153 RepID=UPI00096B394A|nr:acyl-CoA Delta-9 desaturase [Aethina tumida]
MGSETELSTKRERNWMKVLFHLQMTISFLCSLHYVINQSYWTTIFYSIFIIMISYLGVTAGAHRLWAHKSYTANTQLRFFLAMCQTLAGCGSIYDWVRWHRLHHKHFNTVLDPFNPSLGWFYAHINSNTLSLSPAQEKALEEIDMSDLENDKIVMYQKKLYNVLYIFFTFLIVINAPAEYWGEDILTAIFIAGWMRYYVTLHLVWLINSATRIWGLQPGEKYPCDTNLVFILSKNFWLSYHYLAPWDYQTSEYSKYGTDYVSTFIRVCAALEYATDLRTIDSESVRSALFTSMREKKNIQEALEEASDTCNLPKTHYLTPSKYY